MTETESESWLTTHSSVAVRKRAETGSRPTGMLAAGAGGDVFERVKSSTRLSAVLQAARVVASGERSSGWTWGVSKLTKSAWAIVAVRRIIRGGSGRNMGEVTGFRGVGQTGLCPTCERLRGASWRFSGSLETARGCLGMVVVGACRSGATLEWRLVRRQDGREVSGNGNFWEQAPGSKALIFRCLCGVVGRLGGALC